MRASFNQLLMISVLALGLSACKKVDVPNGEIPDQYREAAAKYMGTYTGKMQRRNASFTLSLNGKKVALSFSDAKGNDWIDPRCGSVVGDLKNVDIKEKDGNYTLTAARFAFDPRNCVSVEGREIEILFTNRSSGIQATPQILDRVSRGEECYWEVGPPGGGARRVCRPYMRTSYFTGRFLKK